MCLPSEAHNLWPTRDWVANLRNATPSDGPIRISLRYQKGRDGSHTQLHKYAASLDMPCAELHLPIARALITSSSTLQWEAGALLVAALLFTFWGRQIYIAGMSMDCLRIIACIEERRCLNAQLVGIVTSAWKKGGIHVIPVAIEIPQGLLRPIPARISQAFDKHWDMASRVHSATEFIWDCFPQAQAISRTHGKRLQQGGAGFALHKENLARKILWFLRSVLSFKFWALLS